MAAVTRRQQAPNSYDLIAYPGKPHAGAHCRNLEAIAALFNAAPVAPTAARVLELGCATGANFLPQAFEYPDARFVGCDLSATAIASAAQVVEALGLRNVELRHASISDVGADWGQFDYILCHGVFSWVGPPLRRKIMEILRGNLAPQGVAYVSYNCYPGWHLRGSVRELLCRHVAGIDDPRQAIAQARQILALAAEVRNHDGPYRNLIRDEYLLLSHADESYLYHEMLEEHNQPFYFEEFVAQAESAGLQYLADADYSAMYSWDLPPTARDFLAGVPFPAREAQLDWLRGCAFRRSLLCHREVQLDHQVDPMVLNTFAIALADDATFEKQASAKLTPETEPDGDENVWLLRTNRCELRSADPLIIAAVRKLEDRRPEFVSLQELRDQTPRNVGQRSGGAMVGASSEFRNTDRNDPFAHFFLDALEAGVVEASLSPPNVASRIGDRPTVSRLAAFQASYGNWVTNQRHRVVPLSDLGRLLAQLLDGTRDCRIVQEIITQELESGRVKLCPFDEVAESVTVTVRGILEMFRREALLVTIPEHFATELD